MHRVIGIDLGGTAIKGGLFSTNGECFHSLEILTENRAFHPVCDQIVRVAKSLGSKADSTIVGIGLGVPGGIKRDKATIHFSPNFPEWSDVDMKNELEARGLQSVTIENDANCAAITESVLGAGRKYESMALFTLGTGVGGGIILDREVVHGHWGMAGELGHIPIFPDGLPCSCGSRGCLEQYASGSAIIKAASEYWNRGLIPEWSREPATSLDVYQCAIAGNRWCLSIFQTLGRALGIAISGLIHSLNLPMFVIGGGVGQSFDLFKDALQQEIVTRTFPIAANGVQVTQAVFGNEAGMIGAALLASRKWSDGR